jgi:beta-lactam-binding protein with PASTA domain
MALEEAEQVPRDSEASDESKRDRARGLGIALVAAVIALSILWWIYLQTTVVPDTVGRSQAEAQQLLENADLELGDVLETRSRQQPAGHVVEQSLAKGARVMRGSAVDLVLSTGSRAADGGDGSTGEDSLGFEYPPTETAEAHDDVRHGGGGISRVGGPWVPNVHALTERQARSRLVAAGYKVRVKFGPVTSGPDKGLVFYQDPEPDASAVRGTVVEIWISTGGPGFPTLEDRPQ